MPNNKSKINIYKQIVGFVPDAIVLISGGAIKEIGKDGTARYRSTKTNEGDAFGILWGEARTLAVAELATCFPLALIIATNTLSVNEKVTIPAIREELEQLSISKDRILLEKDSPNTLSQITKALKIIYEKEIMRVVFITNEYHIPRVRALYENFESLATPNKETKRIIGEVKSSEMMICFAAAEAILPYRDKKFIEIIGRMKKDPAYQKRIQNEQYGVVMIKSGKYGIGPTEHLNKSERVLQYAGILRSKK